MVGTHGTLLHYYEKGEPVPDADTVLALPPSKTGRRALISKRTLELTTALRQRGVKLTLVSGVRYSTFVDRLPYLPHADAYCIENGGRIFYPTAAPSPPPDGSTYHTAPPEHCLQEDLKWREGLESVCGKASENDPLDAERRAGPVWDLCRALRAEGWTVDTATYNTMLRINAGEGDGEARLLRRMASLPPSFLIATNFGLVDVMPRASGKLHVARYLAAAHFKFEVPDLGGCAAMGDDDNDIEMLSAAGRGAFVTGFSSRSIEAAARAAPRQFRVAAASGVAAAEECLEAILSLGGEGVMSDDGAARKGALKAELLQVA
ncbi:HAD-like protein [Tribonema minus]|uniref:HAD-like protein n=1 Tax=Tribonema minus TaxID=303371 RepID=A0A836CQU9_9STRA|nr:HAD-like protein [Tribonema minus]